MLREHVGGIIDAGYFDQFKVLASQSVLNPKVCRGKMSDFSESTPSGDPDCGSGIGKDRESKVYAKICRQGLESEALG